MEKDEHTYFEEYLAAIIDSWRQGDGYVYEHLEGVRNDARTILEKAKEELNNFLPKPSKNMDYEKKYNEALSQARFYYGNCPTEPEKKKLENIFPELRASEDESIRRTLVEYFGPSAQLDFIRGVPIQKIRDWLEKQKEPHIPWYDYQKSKEAGYTIVPNEEYEQLIKQKKQGPQEPQVLCEAKAFDLGYKQAEKDILSFVESRISEIIGDAQPKPALRAELEELIKRIKDGNNAGRANTTM